MGNSIKVNHKELISLWNKAKRLKGNHQLYGVRILPELGFDTTNMVKGLHMAGRSVILDLYLREEIEISTIYSYYIGETINIRGKIILYVGLV